MISNELLKKKILDDILEKIDEKYKVKLEKISSVISKGTTPRGGNVAYVDDGILFIRAENIGTYEINLLNKKYIDNVSNNTFLKRSILEQNDILISIAGALGRVAYVNKTMLPCNCNQAVAFVRINKNINFVPKYICYFISSSEVQNNLLLKVKKTAQPNLTLQHIKNIEIKLPPLEEQEEIVKKIEELFELVDKKEKNDKEKEKLKTLLKEKILDSAIHGELVENDLSLPTVDVEEIKEDIPFGIPNNWKWTYIKYVGDVIGGGTPDTKNPEYWNGNINWITPADMKSNDKYIRNGKKNITEKGLIESSARIMPKGAIVISSRAPIGYVKISSEPVTTSQGCKSIVVNDKKEIFNEYIYYYIKSITDYLNSIGTGTTFKEISGKTLSKVFIPIPPLEQQKKIVEKIEKCFELIEQL